MFILRDHTLESGEDEGGFHVGHASVEFGEDGEISLVGAERRRVGRRRIQQLRDAGEEGVGLVMQDAAPRREGKKILQGRG